jgi:hypothetical protein
MPPAFYQFKSGIFADKQHLVSGLLIDAAPPSAVDMTRPKVLNTIPSFCTDQRRGKRECHGAYC